MTDKDNVAFLPFHAINEFMRDDYREAVISLTLKSRNDLPKHLRASLDKAIRKTVKVPGFRNSANAPLTLIIRHAVKIFEKSPQLVSVILAGWSEIHHDLRGIVFNLLTLRGWDVLPLDANRTKLPGFNIEWPNNDNFDVLYTALSESHPQFDLNNDDVSLMVVWLGMCLPYNLNDEVG